MKKMYIFLLLSLFLFGCSNPQKEPPEESSVHSAESEHIEITAAETQQENKANSYYRMTYAKPPINISEIMKVLLTEDAEKAAFEAAETSTSTLSDGRILQEGAMTVNGIAYQWSECAGSFSFYKECATAPIQINDAEKLAHDFLERLGWEYCEDLQICLKEDGTVDIYCRLSYHGIKLMGSHTLYFEPGNEDELGLSGSYIRLSLVETGINSIQMESIPQDGDILQTYDTQNDLLSLEKAKDAANQYLEVEGSQLLFPGDELITEEMSVERIYMPYRDASNGNRDALIPAFEVRIPYKAADMPDETLVLYMDALTGYVYDVSFEFF